MEGAVIDRDGTSVSVQVRAVVPKLGPLAIIGLAGAGRLPSGYAEQVRRATDPAAIITVLFRNATVSDRTGADPAAGTHDS